ncbi:hypothetical protein LJR220_005421 [Bradyrhizobium sp. LjRoot220]|uniref:hypothetical protein n=1 Tax=Bradyrhizobium sp. LjRoot220 TaxID=3342284 RepID=UPI003ECD06C1
MGQGKAILQARHQRMVVAQVWLTCRRPELCPFTAGDYEALGLPYGEAVKIDVAPVGVDIAPVGVDGALTFVAGDTVLIVEPAVDARPGIVLPDVAINGMLGNMTSKCIPLKALWWRSS